MRYYVTWVSQLYSFCKKDYKSPVSSEEISHFLKQISKSREHWQVQQASDAIHTYQFYIRRKKLHNEPHNTEPDELWKTVADDTMRMIRLRHLSLRTEKTYLGWLRSFYKFLKGKSPKDLDQSDVKDFLTYLAVDRRVSSSTQNQAFNAILFFYRHILDVELEGLDEVIRAPYKRRLPVVLNKQEVVGLFKHLSGKNLLMAKVIYGCGLRLQECLNLRIKDLDFRSHRLTVRFGKGNKDRQTLLPTKLIEDLNDHIRHGWALYNKDQENRIAGVYLPYALERKYPNAGKEWAWQWVFPSQKLSVDPRSKIIRRHHVHPSNLQRAIKKATKQASIVKRVTVHTLRHSFATHSGESTTG